MVFYKNQEITLDLVLSCLDSKARSREVFFYFLRQKKYHLNSRFLDKNYYIVSTFYILIGW